MESQLPRSYGHHYEQESHIQPLGEEEHHEKKSVLGKVKEKAKKIKNTLKKHGHGHDHDHEDDDNELDEEIVEDPEIHGAPIYDSATITSTQTPRTAEFDTGVHRGNLEKPSAMKEDRYESMFEEPPVRTFAQWEEEDQKSQNKPGDKPAPFSDLRADVGGRGGNFGGFGVRMEEDTNAPGKDRIFGDPSNYETKVADSTGRGRETGVTPILHSLDKMGIYDENSNKSNLDSNPNYSSTTRSHDQPSAGMYDEIHNILGTKQNLGKPTGTRQQFSSTLHNEPKNKPNLGGDQSISSTTGSHDQFSPVVHEEPGNKMNLMGTNRNIYGERRTSPDLGDKQNLSSTHNYEQHSAGIYEPHTSPDLGGEQSLSTTRSHDQHSAGIYDEPRTNLHLGSKMNVDDKHGHISQGKYDEPLNIPNVETRQTFGETNDSTPKSGDGSSYTSMISSAASSVAEKAISAKDAVASTLGYSGADTGKGTTTNPGQGGGLAAKVTETLAPVYEKVAGAGNAVISKVSPTDKNGASSVKEYWAEKLKPGEEDKALSDVISGATSAKPEGVMDTDKRGTREVFSDAVHKRAPDESKTTTGATARVTESKDLAKRLDLESDRDVGEGVGVGKGMVEVIRGTVNSWMGKENPQGNAGDDTDRAKTAVKDS